MSTERTTYLERTIAQLDTGTMPAERAAELGMYGYVQWLATLPGNADYRGEVERARSLAAPFVAGSPAVGAFCRLLAESLAMPPRPLPLALAARRRRGGARARRAVS